MIAITRMVSVRWRVFVAATLATLTVGLGAFAVVYTAVDKVLIERMPYRKPDNLYFVWCDQSASGGPHAIRSLARNDRTDGPLSPYPPGGRPVIVNEPRDRL